MLQQLFVAGLHPVLQEQGVFHQEQADSGHHEQAPPEHHVQDFCMELALCLEPLCLEPWL